MRRNRPQTMKGRTVKFTLGMIGVLTVSAIVWRFYDPMPDVPMPTRKLPNPNGYDALVNIVQTNELPDDDTIPINNRLIERDKVLTETEKFLGGYEKIFPEVERALSLPFVPPLPSGPIAGQNNFTFFPLYQLAEVKAETTEQMHKIQDSFRYGVMHWRLNQRVNLCTDNFKRHDSREIRYRLYRISTHEEPKDASIYAQAMEDDLKLRPNFESFLKAELENFQFIWLNRMKKPGWISDKPPRNPLDWDYAVSRLIKKRTFMDAGLRDRQSKLRFIQKHQNWSDATYSKIEFGGLAQYFDLGLPIANGDSDYNAWFLFERERACDRLLMTYFALTAFRQAHGSYPQSLSELVPEFLEQVPIDPFGSGNGFQYHKTGTSFILYSIGPDQIDDVGIPILKDIGYGRKACDMARQSDRGDIVWGINKI